MQGRPPLVIDLQAFNDDDHVIAVFKQENCWGAIAKSNFTTLRYREPVYRTLRELAMSYFDFYFNTPGDIGYFLDKMNHFPLISGVREEYKPERLNPKIK